jgi:membrane protein required for beta-lactamase induction
LKLGDRVRRLRGVVPRSVGEAEVEVKYLLKVLFWLALLAPVVILPAYYLLVAYGVLPQIHLPAG